MRSSGLTFNIQKNSSLAQSANLPSHFLAVPKGNQSEVCLRRWL